jgi:hypothetical protein
MNKDELILIESQIDILPTTLIELENNYVLSPENAIYIWRTSFLFFISSISALYNGYLDFAIVLFCIFLTSINYWRKPTYSWRRNLDIICASTGIIYKMIRAYQAEYSVISYILIIMSICFYYLGVYCDRKKLYLYSTYFHCSLHIFSNLSCIILYSGYVVPIESNAILSSFYSYFTITKSCIINSCIINYNNKKLINDI